MIEEGSAAAEESAAAPENDAGDTAGATATPRPRGRSRGGRGRSRGGTRARPAADPEAQPDEPQPDEGKASAREDDSRPGGDEDSAEPSEPGTPTAAAPRRRRRRGGRGRRRSGAGAAAAVGAGGRRSTAKVGDDAAPREGAEAPSEAEAVSGGATADVDDRADAAATVLEGVAESESRDDEQQAARRPARRRRGGRGRRKPAAARGEGAGTAEGEEAAGEATAATTAAPAQETKEAPKQPEAKRAPSRRQRPEPVRSRRRIGRRREAVRPVERRSDKRMIITEVDERDQIAVLEGRELVEHYITRAGARSMVGNVYVGRVQNVLAGMEAAFVDVGRGRNGVLYAGEVNYDEEVEGAPKRIEEALKPGQKVLVQVTKDPIGGKGARLTAQVSLPGRFLVIVPDQQVFGISRRLPDAERTRLRSILKPLRPNGHGVIARTAAEGASAEDLEADLKRLVAEWEDVSKRAKRAKPPKLVYEEPELTVRVVRDVFTEEEFEELVTDSPAVYERVTSYLRDVAPDLLDRVRLYEEDLPLLEEYHVAEQIRKALERKVWLPSGGYLIIDRTEAMTVIDVNTGKHVGATNLEETVTKTNLEAAEEIARQLRLRDIGGMIIIDFIDMLFERNRGKVIRAVKEALAKDRTRSQVFDISPLGLLEVTRKRVSAGLVEAFSHTCPTCEGRGILLTHDI